MDESTADTGDEERLKEIKADRTTKRVTSPGRDKDQEDGRKQQLRLPLSVIDLSKIPQALSAHDRRIP